jgi:predicted site-specific integrase-resolvase
VKKRLVKIDAATKILGPSPDTLRKWKLSGEVLPDRKTRGGTRYYDLNELLNLEGSKSPTVDYARVSSHDQKAH